MKMRIFRVEAFFGSNFRDMVIIEAETPEKAWEVATRNRYGNVKMKDHAVTEMSWVEIDGGKILIPDHTCIGV
jgi:hypothetical protein